MFKLFQFAFTATLAFISLATAQGGVALYYENQRLDLPLSVLGLNDQDLDLTAIATGAATESDSKSFQLPDESFLDRKDEIQKITQLLMRLGKGSEPARALLQFDPSDLRTTLQIESVNESKNKVSYRFGQFIQISRNVGPIRVAGANLVVVTDQNGKIQLIKSGLILRKNLATKSLPNPDESKTVFSKEARESLLALLAPYSKELSAKAKVGDQTAKHFVRTYLNLENFSEGLRSTTLSRLLIATAREHSLSFAIRPTASGPRLVSKFTAPFGLPIAFEIERADNNELIVRSLGSPFTNLIEIYRPKSSLFGDPGIEPESSPKLSANTLDEINESDAKDSTKATARIFLALEDFYKKNYGRKSYDNRGARANILIEVKHKDVIDNAAWADSLKKFFIGAGGKYLKDLGQAVDVLGHEYFHAVDGGSANLISENQSGGIAEHGADILGLYFELQPRAKISLKEDLAIGETTLGDELISEYHEKTNRNLKSLRHLLDSSASLEQLVTSMDTALEKYDSYCTPDSENDRCGVHYWAGIPNYALGNSMVDYSEKKFGGDAKKALKFIADLVYETFTTRLTQRPDMKEYLNELMTVCSEKAAAAGLVADDCSIIENNFQKVGLSYKRPTPSANDSGNGGTADSGSDKPSDNADETVKSAEEMIKELCDTWATKFPNLEMPALCK